jgi:hypothetical protein
MNEEFDLLKYRIEHPMDYIKAINLINEDPTNHELSKIIYKLTRLHIPDKIYKYFSLTSDESLNELKFNTLEDKKIYVAEASSLNDPYEAKAFYYNAEKFLEFERLKSSGGRLIDDFSAYVRLSSFTVTGINNMPMWAHYSNNHAGYCVEYLSQAQENLHLRSSLFPVQYVDERVDITNFMYSFVKDLIQSIEKNIIDNQKKTVINNFIVIWISVYFSCLKHSSWSYENEIRFITSSSNSPLLNATPSSIYIGEKCSQLNKDRLCQIAKQINIPIFEMKMEEYSLNYELVPKEIV